MDSSQRRIALVAVLIVAVAALVGGAAAFGLGPFGGGAGDGGMGDGGAGDGGGGTDTPPPTGTVYTQTQAGGGGNQTQLPPFTFVIDKIEKCGQTCRDVTVTLYNNQNTTATNVTVFTRIYAGNSTSQSDKVWEGEEDVGTMKPHSNVTRTQRVDLTTSEGFKVQQNDGWITILTTVSSDDVTITFKNRRDVA